MEKLVFKRSDNPSISQESPSQFSKDVDKKLNVEVNKIELEDWGSTTLATFDEDHFIKQLFENRGFYLNENWTKTFNVQGRILKATKLKIFVECIIDKQNKKFQVREFPTDLFFKFNSVKQGTLVLLKISSKPGSSRIDVYDGKGLVNKELFKLKDAWDELEDSGLDEPYSP